MAVGTPVRPQDTQQSVSARMLAALSPSLHTVLDPGRSQGQGVVAGGLPGSHRAHAAQGAAVWAWTAQPVPSLELPWGAPRLQAGTEPWSQKHMSF